MSRVVRTQSISTQRTRLSKSIVIAIREIYKKHSYDNEVREITAYIVIALLAIGETIDMTVEPWEKRGYWVKADRFRMEWKWVLNLSRKLRNELNNNEWDSIIPLLVEIGSKFNKIQVSERHRMGKPWIGAMDEYNNRELHLDG